MSTITLVTNATANGSTPWRSIISEGTINLYVVGDLGGGTVTLEAKAPNNSAVLVDNGTITAAGMYKIDAASFPGRVTLTGATSPSVSVYIESESTSLRKIVRNRT